MLVNLVISVAPNHLGRKQPNFPFSKTSSLILVLYLFIFYSGGGLGLVW